MGNKTRFLQNCGNVIKLDMFTPMGFHITSLKIQDQDFIFSVALNLWEQNLINTFELI